MTEYRECSDCGLEKELNNENFRWRNDRKCWNGYVCKVCQNENSKKYNKEHKEEMSEYQKQYYEENKEDILKDRKEYRKNNKEEISKYKKKYNQEHKDEINEKRRNRRKNDLIYKLHQDMSNAVNNSLKELNLSKNNKSI